MADRGGIVLMFDDGYRSWNDIFLPILSKYNGFATGFLTNKNMHKGMVTESDIHQMVSSGWEIGCHTFNHIPVEYYLTNHTVDEYVRDEIVASINDFAARGIEVKNFCYPGASYTDETNRRLLHYFHTLRFHPGYGQYRDFGSANRYTDGYGFDKIYNVTAAHVKQWIDGANDPKRMLFVYAHDGYRDDQYFEGTVERVEMVNGYTIMFDSTANFTNKVSGSRIYSSDINTYSSEIVGYDPNYIIIEGSLPLGMGVGDAYRIMPTSLGVRESDFEEIVSYASERLDFYTVEQFYQMGSRFSYVPIALLAACAGIGTYAYLKKRKSRALVSKLHRRTDDSNSNNAYYGPL